MIHVSFDPHGSEKRQACRVNELMYFFLEILATLGITYWTFLCVARVLPLLAGFYGDFQGLFLHFPLPISLVMQGCRLPFFGHVHHCKCIMKWMAYGL